MEVFYSVDFTKKHIVTNSESLKNKGNGSVVIQIEHFILFILKK